MKGKKHLEPVRDEDGIILFDPTDDYDPPRKIRISNEDNERLQKIARKKGKVTWGDVYADVIKNPDRFAKRGNPEVWVILNTDPTREMECVLDEYDGKFYWMPAMDPQYIAGTYDNEGNLIKKSSLSEFSFISLWKKLYRYGRK